MNIISKKGLLTLAPYLAVILILVCTEIGLRLWAPKLANPLVKEVQYDQIDWYQINRGALAKYFSSGTPLVPEFKESLFRKEKKENTYRVFCLGESSMFGVPYQMTANIPGLLRVMLREEYPGKEFEVVNWGASAINSNAVLALSKEIARYKPDLICVYMGHNEFYGPDGVGASFVERHLPFLIPLKYKVRDLRLVKLLSGLLPEAGKEPQEGLNLMKQVSEGAHVRLGSSDAAWVFGHFESNLADLIGFWRGKNVPVIVSDISSNLMFPPFEYDGLPAGTVEKVLGSFQAGKYDTVFTMLRAMHERDSSNAFVEYWLGKSSEALGYYWGSSKAYFVNARDNDLLKFRAPSRINEIIRTVCREQAVPCISTDSLFTSLSTHDIPGGELFWEHLHPKVNGYYAIARLFNTAVEQNRLIPGEDYSVRRPVIPYNLNRLAVCWLDQAYGDLSIQHLTSRWPFENYKRASAVIDSADGVLKAIAANVYERKVVWDEACYESAEYFWRRGRNEEARTTYEAIIQEYPYNYYAHYLLGSLLSKQGDPQEALKHFDISVRSKPDYPNSRLDAGLLLINQGEFRAAMKLLRDALSYADPNKQKGLRANILYGLAAAEANMENYDDALKKLGEALELVPQYGDALRLKEGILRHLGRQG